LTLLLHTTDITPPVSNDTHDKKISSFIEVQHLDNMASMLRPKSATYVINEKVTIDTTDREDHTFCGIAFPIQCKKILPVCHIVINSISVRGALGELSVYITKKNSVGITRESPSCSNSNRGQNVHYNLRQRDVNESTVQMGEILMKEQYWSNIYKKKHGPSFRTYQELDLSSRPIVLKPGEVRCVYIHSKLDSDQAIVYDNSQNHKTHDDQFITVLPGRAHVSSKAFGTTPIWGWGNAWRDNREFVGKISYGVVYKLWNPTEHLSFGDNFRRIARILFMCQRRWESPMSSLPDDCIFYILNMCRWDWMKDSAASIRTHKKNMNRRAIVQEEARAQALRAEQDNDNDDSSDHDIAPSGIVENMDVDMSDEDEYDSSYVGSDEEDSDEDDGYDDHRGSSIFKFNCYDDYESSEEEESSEEIQQRVGGRRIRLLRSHFCSTISHRLDQS